MSNYYLRRIEDDVVIVLDATSTLTESFTGSVTSNPVADRTVVNDTYINNNPVFTLTGIISGVTQPSRAINRPISEVTEEMIDTITRGNIVDFISADRVYNTCIITNINKTKTSREGKEGWKVIITLSQLNLVEALRVTIDESPIEAIADDAANRKNIDKNTTELLRVNALDQIIDSLGLGGGGEGDGNGT